MTQEYIHVTRTGEEIPISQMDTGHLCAQIALIQRLALTGLTYYIVPMQPFFDEDPCIDELVIYGEEVKQKMNYYEYVAEWKKRVRMVSEKPIPIPK